MRRALFIDRDGTINHDPGYVHHVSGLKIYPDIAKIIRRYKKQGYLTVVITNQSGIGRGYYTETQMKQFNAEINRRLKKVGAAIDAFYWCPHLPDDGCDCRKPGAGMVKKAAKDLNIDLSKSMLIGDTDKTDGALARSLKMKYKILKRKKDNTTPELVIVLCGGLGTRLRPLTYNFPKPMAKVNGKPIIGYVLDNLLRIGVNNIVLAIGYKGKMIRDYVDSRYAGKANISYSVEKELLGTGGGLRKAAESVKFPYQNFLMVHGDDITNIDVRKVYKFHVEKKAPVTIAVLKLDHVNISGAVEVKGSRVTKFIEKPDPKIIKTTLMAAGIYAFRRDALKLFPKRKVFNLSKDFLEPAVNKKKGIVYGYISKHRWYPIDTPERYVKARRALEKAKR